MDRNEDNSIYDDPSRNRKKKKSKYKRNRKFFIFFFVILMVYFGSSILKTQWRLYLVNQEIEQVEAKLLGLNEIHDDLIDKKIYVESDEYIEYKARKELGLIKENERVIVITEPEDSLQTK